MLLRRLALFRPRILSLFHLIHPAKAKSLPQVECATTFCVVNLQPNEARVEALLDRYVSLAEEERYNQDDNKHTFTYDDDEADAYQVC